MNDERKILAERVSERIELLGRTPREVSLAASGKPDLVRDIVRMRRMPTAPVMLGLAHELQTTTDWLLGRSTGPEQPVSEVRFAESLRPFRGAASEGIPLMGTGFCADLEVESDTGEVIPIEQALFEEDHVVRLIERPPALSNARDAYAIYYQGSSMEPRYYQGEIGVVDPQRPPGPGDFVVVQLCDGQTDDVVTVIVKQLVRTTSAYVELRQFNPPATFRIARRKVKRIHRIVGPNEAYGV